jgi:trehalose 6-phosphate phosphatase
LELAAHAPGLLALGLYGLEEAAPDGTVRSVAEADRWRPAVRAAAERAESDLPGLFVERKGLSTTLHWRQTPEAEAAARAEAERLAAELGLDVRYGRMSAELVPPLPVDKGGTVARLCAGATAALFVGDDVGDVPALLALGRLRAAGALETLAVAVQSEETPAELVAAADLVVDGVAGAVALLTELDDTD